MNFTEYQPLARKTLKELPYFDHLVHMALGVVGELGEIVDAVKKVAIYGKAPDQINFAEEIGDVMWYVINLLQELQVPVSVLEEAFNKDYAAAQQQIKISAPAPLELGAVMVLVSMACTAAVVPLVDSDEQAVQPGSEKALSVVQLLASQIALLCAMLRVDVNSAMDLNIAKLKARYGDKFSEESALNRDLGVERAVLEGGTLAVGGEVVANTVVTGVQVDPVVSGGGGDFGGGGAEASYEEDAKPAIVVDAANIGGATLPILPIGDSITLDDKPLAGGFCDPEDKSCEGCQ